MAEPKHGNVFVSLQAREHEEGFVKGHRATGVLLAADKAFFPRIPADVVDDAGSCRVLLVPLAADVTTPAESIRPARVEVHLVEPDGIRMAAVRLARPARVSPPPVHRSDGSAFSADLRRHRGDFVAVLGMRGVATDAFHLDPAEVLADVMVTAEEDDDPRSTARGETTASLLGLGEDPEEPWLCRWLGFC